MQTAPRYPILGVLISAVTLEAAAQAVIAAAQAGQPLAVSALAVHGVMTGALDPVQRYRLNHLDMLTPDGQPVRWALGWLHGVRLRARVYGPDLTLRVCALAAEAGLPVFFYGSTPETLARLRAAVAERFPGLRVHTAPSRFRRESEAEQAETAAHIRASGARLVLCGLGCPRQETWAFEMRDRLGVPVLAVGAAFDFLGGSKAQAPAWMQARGLEWLFRLVREPRRLWRRYLLLNPAYLALIAMQRVGVRTPGPAGTPPAAPERFG
jgi:exopolysaccharide biosynthesis WecB/TagA/CpsF family protein